jgi:hypothetical protein
MIVRNSIPAIIYIPSSLNIPQYPQKAEDVDTKTA